MSERPEPERDRFDQWINDVLMAGSEEAEPSAQVWQRIAGTAARSLQPAGARPGGPGGPGGGVHLFTTKLTWLELRGGVIGMAPAGMGIGWWWQYPRPLPYA